MQSNLETLSPAARAILNAQDPALLASADPKKPPKDPDDMDRRFPKGPVVPKVGADAELKYLSPAAQRILAAQEGRPLRPGAASERPMAETSNPLPRDPIARSTQTIGEDAARMLHLARYGVEPPTKSAAPTKPAAPTRSPASNERPMATPSPKPAGAMPSAGAIVPALDLRQIAGQPMAIAPHYTGLVADIQAAAGMTQEDASAHMDRIASSYGASSLSPNKPFAFFDGVAVIPIHGTLLNRYPWISSYASGYGAIRSLINAAMADDDVKVIVADINSFGGMVAGCKELADDIFEMRGQKPMMAVVDSNCYSAAYALASAFDRIAVTPTGGAGSIGVAVMHMSLEKALSGAGIEITFIHAGKHKVDGNPYQNLPADVRKTLQASVEACHSDLVAQVARNRGLSEAAVRSTEAQIYHAAEAKNLGLIDSVASPTAAIRDFLSGVLR